MLVINCTSFISSALLVFYPLAVIHVRRADEYSVYRLYLIHLPMFRQMAVTYSVLRIRDVYPGSLILIFTDPGSQIPDPETATKEMGEKNCCYTFFCSHKFHSIENYFIFEMAKKKIWTNYQRIIELFTQKIVSKLSKIWVWDPRSEIQNKPILDPGSRGQKGTGSRIRIHNTGLIHFPSAVPDVSYILPLSDVA
jgi:hypothetical protein